MKIISTFTFALLIILGSLNPSYAASSSKILLETSLGDITIELDAAKAPITVKNFLSYVESGHYAGTVFHRVIPGFMIQGGGMTADIKEKPTKAPIKNEATNGLKNTTGTISMARTNVVDSATSQFFINVNDNFRLDHSSDSYGYAVFGKVIKGMNVVKAIERVKTGSRNGHNDVPVDSVTIKSAKVMK